LVTDGVIVVGTTALVFQNVTYGFAPLVSPALVGVPTAPTAALGANSSQVATTGFVQQEIAADLATLAPLMAGTAAVGTSIKLAREDHRHPTDTSRAPLASPVFTGAPTAPTVPRFDTSLKLMNGAAVATRGHQFSTFTAFSGALAGIVGHVGGVVHCSGATANSYSLPDSTANSIPPGATVRVQNWGVNVLGLAIQGADKMQENIDGAWTTTTRSIPPDTYVDCLYIGTGLWLLTGPGVVGKTRPFGALLALAGYQRLPSGLIMQWFTANFVGPYKAVAFNLPIAFPSQFLGCNVSMTESAIYDSTGQPFVAGMPNGLGQVLLQSNYTASASAVRVLAFGV